MDREVNAQIGAKRYERAEGRTTQHNGLRVKQWDTRLGTLEDPRTHVSNLLANLRRVVLGRG